MRSELAGKAFRVDHAAPGGPMEREEMVRLMKHGLAVEEVLQAVEDVLVETGYDDLAVTTDRGTFRWQTLAYTRAKLNEPGDELEH
jgi:hypothetical protein